MPLLARANAVLRTLHWRRGLRAGVSVASAMLVCRALGRPMGWAALGGFEAVLVDNGGPYRSRMNTISTVLFGGALCGIIGSLVPQRLPIASLLPGDLLIAALITAAVCFLVTFARVAAQPIASTSVIILVLYFAGYGSSSRTFAGASANALAYILGGLWAAAISLFFWPVDPFRPARLEVAACYDLLAAFTANLHAAGSSHSHPAHDDDHAHAVDFKRQLRTRLESARAALGATPARAPTRTHRARNLSVLLETADMLFAATLRLTELGELVGDHSDAPLPPDTIEDIAHWLSGAERAIADGLKARPADNAASFGPNGSHRIEYVTRRTTSLTSPTPFPSPTAAPVLAHLLADERDALQNIDIAFEALQAVWTGIDASPGRNTPASPALSPDPAAPPAWLDALRQNWTLDSIMMRHALRMAAVGAADVLLMRVVRVNHGFWLAMTSIIVLQPHSTGTLRKGLERVGGTIAGGIFAALLAAVIHSYVGIIAVITACSILALATYAVDYGWYSFFLTPTFILLSLPYLRDWRYAGIRIFTTMLGAVVAVLAMRLLWPQSLTSELSSLLARSATASAAYIRAVLNFWDSPSSPARARIAAERTLLAPARRACGLASQDAEEALDRALLDPGLPSLASRHAAVETESALTFTTFIRRFTQCLTTLAAVGAPTPAAVSRLTSLITRLDAIAAFLGQESPAALQAPYDPTYSPPDATHPNEPDAHFNPAGTLAEQMLQRMERQASVLERAASTMVTHSSPQTATTPGAPLFTASS
jgi:uncharacterized membrane protein YccC